MIHHENGIISPKDDALQLILCPKVYTSQLLFTNLPCKDTNYKEKKNDRNDSGKYRQDLKHTRTVKSPSFLDIIL